MMDELLSLIKENPRLTNAELAAALDRDRNIVSFYDMKDGQLLRERSMGDKKMPSAFNDSFADPDNAIFCLNMDGTMLAISFSKSKCSPSSVTALTILPGALRRWKKWRAFS